MADEVLDLAALHFDKVHKMTISTDDPIASQ
jgi:predicted small metal-binding protein